MLVYVISIFDNLQFYARGRTSLYGLNGLGDAVVSEMVPGYGDSQSNITIQFYYLSDGYY